MKLQELARKPFEDLQEDLINEYGYKVPFKWDSVSNGWQCKIDINGEGYILNVTRLKPKARRDLRIGIWPNLKTLQIYSFEYSKVLESSKLTQDTTQSATHIAGGRKVIFAVGYAVSWLLKTEPIDILLFAAKRSQSPTNFESRASLYQNIPKYMSREGMTYINIINAADDNITAVFSNPRFHRDLVNLSEYLKQYFTPVDIKQRKHDDIQRRRKII